MHGLIFASLRDYCRERVGADATREIFEGRMYTITEAHPDEELARLLRRAAPTLGLEGDELLRDFGAFTAEKMFTRLYPSFFALAGDTRSFLLTIEDLIHELVRATIPNAEPPALKIRPAGADACEIEYTSPRRLCRLLEGLVVGTARHYGETVEIVEVSCMRNGAPACRFKASVARA
jgi:predicted hydrocarbon binding protein